jgi:LmbE family N-acetylglucosaminyl deacetylase
VVDGSLATLRRAADRGGLAVVSTDPVRPHSMRTEPVRTGQADSGSADRAARADRRLFGTGTSAAAWHTWTGWRSAPEVDLDELVPAGHRLLVVAAHPDDEVLGSGGLLHLAAEAGRDVLVLIVTDGEGSHPGSARWPAQLLGSQRISESRAALRELGLGVDQVVRLGFSDGHLPREQADVSRAIVRALSPHDVVVTPWRYDGHVDHEIIANAVVDALQVLPVAHLEVPIWGLHWARPDDEVLPWDRAVRLRLDAATLGCKETAVGHFISQLEPDPSTGRDAALPRPVLDRMVCDDEVYFR